MSNWKRVLIPIAMLALLPACGGGGDDSTESLGDKSFPAAAASQTFANSAVSEVNDLVMDIREAEISGSLPVGAGIVGLPLGATTTGTLDCADYGAGGSGTIDYRYTYSGSRPISWRYEYNECTFASSGYTFTMDGTQTLEYSDWDDSSHYTYTVSYDITYTLTGPGYSNSSTLQSSQTCTQDGEDLDCRYSVGGGYALGGEYEVDIDDEITTIEYALIDGANATIEIVDWVYNTDLGRATSGTISIDYDSGDSLVISATGTGYEVHINIGMSSYDFAVTF